MPVKMSAEEFARRVAVIKSMTKSGTPRIDIAKALGISSSAVCQFVTRYMSGKVIRQTDRRDSGRRDFTNEQPWQVGDPSTLSEQALETCRRANIKPERMAWLLSCPRGGYKVSKLREGGLL